jgi:hypothetical protein
VQRWCRGGAHRWFNGGAWRGGAKQRWWCPGARAVKRCCGADAVVQSWCWLCRGGGAEGWFRAGGAEGWFRLIEQRWCRHGEEVVQRSDCAEVVQRGC